MIYRTIRDLLFLILLIFFLLSSSNAQDMATVETVVDGDTLRLTNGEKVRLIGIDAPESKPNPRAEKQGEKEGKDLKIILSMGEEATKFVRNLVKRGELWGR